MAALDDRGDIPEIATGSNDWEDDDSEDEVTALHDFIAGGLAGSASVVVGHPFDTIKVSQQSACCIQAVERC
jgi:Mitochondrial carrier protein